MSDTHGMHSWRAVWLTAVLALLCACSAPSAGTVLEQRRHASEGASPLPSGRTGYRTYAEVGGDLGELAAARSDVVQRIALPHRTVLGLEVVGVEITHDVEARDGKPVLLVTGAHQGSEWASAEVAVEFATDLAELDGRDPRVTALLGRVRVVVVPVVNPDGFQLSRAGTVPGKRRNCRVDDPATQSCATSPDAGVDLEQDYGAGPVFEPETRNVREVVLGRQVTVFADLRANGGKGLRAAGDADVGRRIAEAGGWELLPRAGATASEWVHAATGAFGFDVELGGEAEASYGVVESYLRGGREALLRAAEAAGDRRYHSVLSGKAPVGAVLSVRGSGEQRSSMVSTGDVEWDVNPSGRDSGEREAWTVECGREDGTVLQSARVDVERGKRVAVDFAECSARWGN